MRKFLYVLGTLMLIIIVTTGLGFGLVIYKGHTLDAESKAFVDSVMPNIAASWSREQLLNQATPELRASVQPEQLKILFDTVSQIGPLVEYQGATGEASMSYMVGSGASVSASYLAKVKCKDGTGTIHIALIKRNGRWMVSGFYVDI